LLKNTTLAVTLETIWKDLHAKKFKPVYFLAGEEAYYIDLIENFIEKNALQDHERDFNQAIFYGKDADPIQVLNEAKQYPSFAERRLVIVREAQEFKAKDWELIEKYIQKPVDSTVLIFSHKNKLPDKRTNFYKSLSKHTEYFESNKVGEEKLADWIAGYVKNKRNYKIQLSTAQVLAENLGNDLSRIANEMDKLSVMLPDNAEITPEIIEKYIGISKEYNMTEFNRAVAQRDFHKAMKIVLYFEKNPKAGPIVGILAYMYNLFARLLIMLHAKDTSSASLQMGFGGKWIPDEYKMAAKVYSISDTQKILSYLCEYDAKAKGLYATDNATSTDLLKELLVKIVSRK